jgi:hypothetical protein
MRPGIRTRDLEQGIDRLHHCARCLIVLTCLWSPNSSLCSLCGQIDLYIRCIPYKWKQIYVRWTCSGGGGESPVCCGGSSILLEVRRWVFPVERTALPSVSVVCRGRGNKSDLQVSFLAFSYLLHYCGPCLNMRYTRNIVALHIWLGQC